MDQLERGINRERTIRVVAAVTTELVREACRRHDITGPEAVVLGRALTGGCLLATLTKRDDERVRIQLDGGGPVGRILVDSRSDGTVRGCLQRRVEPRPTPEMAINRLTIGPLVGRDGTLTVTRDVGHEQQYQGTVEVASGEIDIDIERYLNRSEQLPSALACDVILDSRNEVLRAGGILCQTFPGAGHEGLSHVRGLIHAGGLRDVLRHERSARELMGFALGGEPVENASITELRFRCTCSPERAMAVLTTLGADDVDSLADEPGATEVRCSFCGTRYDVMPEQLRELARLIRSGRS